MQTIAPQQLADLINSGKRVTIIDVRNPDEFEKLRIKNAILQPLPGFKPEETLEYLAERGLADHDIYVTCASGVRAKSACQLFAAHGDPAVTLIEGGTLAWYAAGLPVEGTTV